MEANRTSVVEELAIWKAFHSDLIAYLRGFNWS